MDLEQLNPKQFAGFRDFIYEKSGIRINDNKLSLLSNRIRRRLRAGAFDGFDAYYRHLTSPRGLNELGPFLDEVTTNETSFFRTAAHFDWFKTDFLAQVVAAKRRGEHGPSLRIWSAACAGGAEPYTIAICLLENLFRLRNWSLTILGTDISEEALEAAREGVFKSRSIEAVSERQRRRYFRAFKDDTDRWQVSEEIRRMTRFARHNLMTPSPEEPFDCIFIRNVLIYFDRQSKKAVVDNLIEAIAPGGYLVVGPSEGIYDMLDPLQRHCPFLYQKPHKAGSLAP